MKVLAVLSTLIAIALAVALGITYQTTETSDTQQGQELEVLQMRLESGSREISSLHAQARATQSELDATRNTLAEAKTLENALRLQISEFERKLRLMKEDQANGEQQREALQAELRQVKAELVKLHTTGGSAGDLTEARLRQYEKEIAELQQTVRQLQGTRQ